MVVGGVILAFYLPMLQISIYICPVASIDPFIGRQALNICYIELSPTTTLLISLTPQHLISCQTILSLQGISHQSSPFTPSVLV